MARRKIDAVSQGRFTATVYRDSDWNEYVVRFGWLTSNADYFTTDRQDAFSTAAAEVFRAERNAA